MGESGEFSYDLFVSHAREDRAWVLGFLLPALGLPRERVLTDLVPGRSRVAEIQRAVESSRYTVAVLTRSYLADDWSVFGEQLASHLSVAEGVDGGRIIPLRREAVEIPLHLGFRVWLDCTDPERAQGELERLRDLLGGPVPGPEEEPECPYPGLLPFSEKEEHLFHGREAEVERLLDLLRTQSRLFVIGPSGSGKSSLLRAGLLPRLAGGRAFPRGFWRVLPVRPGDDPVAALASVLGATGEVDLVAAVGRMLAAAPPAEKLLVAIDPLEAVFTLAAASARAGLGRALRELERDGRCVVVLALRADFYADFMTSDLWPLLGSGQRLDVAPLAGEALRAAIEKPAEAVGVYVERALSDRLLTDAANEPGALPLIQETLVALWGRRTRRLLPLTAYKGLSRDGRTGLQVALADRADAALTLLPEPKRAIARRIFLRLVQFGEGRPDTRRQQPVERLLGVAEKDEVQEVLDHLVTHRLLTPTERNGTKAMDLSHEALISGWPTLQDWLAKRRAAEQTRRRLEEKVSEWIRLDRRGGLLDDVEVREAMQWIQSPDGRDLGMGTDFAELVEASRAALEREDRRRKLRVAALWGAIFILLSALAATGWFWNRERVQRAEARQRGAVSLAQALAARALRLLAQERDPDLAGLLAVQAHHLLAENQGVAHLAQIDEALRAVLADQDFSTGLDVSIEIRDMALSGDGRLLAVGSDNGALRVWDLSRPGTLPWFLKSGNGRVSVSFHPEWPLLATSGDDGIRLWNFAGARPQEQLLTNRGASRVLFASDGGRLFLLDDQGTVRVRNIKQGIEATLLAGNPNGKIRRLALSGDGQRLIAAGGKSIWVWETEHLSRPPLEVSRNLRLDWAVDRAGARVANPLFRSVTIDDLVQPEEQSLEFRVPAGATSAAFSPDDQILAVGSLDGDVLVWDLQAADQAPRILRGHGRSIRALRFERTGRLISASGDGTVRLWDLKRSIEEPRVFFGREKDVLSLAFTPDGSALAFGAIGGVRFQALGNSPVSLPPIDGIGAVKSIAFDSRSNALALASRRVVVMISDPRFPNRRTELLLRPVDPASDVAFHPDGSLLVWAAEVAVDVHRIGGPSTYIPLRATGPFDARSVAFSPDGQALAVAGYKGMFLWPSFQPGPGAGEPLQLPAPVRSWYATEFSPDGRWLAAGGASGTLALWEMDRPLEEPWLLVGHRGSVWAVAFDRGHLLASAGQDGIVRLWDLNRLGDEPLALDGGGRLLRAVAFSPDGTMVGAAGEDGLLRIWTVSTETLVSRVCGLVRRNLSGEEWQQHVGADVEYERTCPDLPMGPPSWIRVPGEGRRVVKESH